MKSRKEGTRTSNRKPDIDDGAIPLQSNATSMATSKVTNIVVDKAFWVDTKEIPKRKSNMDAFYADATLHTFYEDEERALE